MMENQYPKRRIIRLQNYDYAQSGYYFVTICAHNRHNLFGQIENGEMKPNQTGKMVMVVLSELNGKFPGCYIEDSVLMPNHLHFIWVNESGHTDLTAAVKWFKGKSTSLFLKAAKAVGADGTLWQRSFYDHVIRNESTHERIREYIRNNPLQWELDRFYRATTAEKNRTTENPCF
ncbi:transposase [Bergeriella denitrificans]|uniref:Putative type I restriction-modification system DNA methylase n=1 Tax=Bergeriella denitrificans TaxID=494 RepID=A0A378UH96_BERDE|nr:transposase [Bergeriella denitrificans]STZ76748.1 putative type I restriction-modification system DNA methylase [Bergeriella denitrificans]